MADLLTALVNLLSKLLDTFRHKKKDISETDEHEQDTTSTEEPEDMVKLPKFRASDMTMFIRRKK